MESNSGEVVTVKLLPWPWVTVSATATCIVIYLGLIETNDYESLDNLRRWGYVNAHSIWNGEYWGLVTSCFVHFDFIHLAFNVYWLWVFGGCFEREFGAIAYISFVAFAAFISSSLQLAFSDSMGIGFSGVGYALFGFAVFARSKIPSFATIIDVRIFMLWFIWLFGCMVLTYLGVYLVGNVAHVSGMIFGGLVAAYFIWGKKLAIPAFIILMILSVIPLFWSPWSIQWLGFKANKYHMLQNYDSALLYYSRIIERDPDAAWAIWNRGCIYYDLKQFEKSSADFELAKSIDPNIENMQEP